MADDSLQAIAAELYGLAPSEFTAARNGYAKELRDQGDRQLSDRVKALRKPAAAAWVVNLLVRHHADEMTQVLELGEALRQAQADLDGDALRELARQRRRLLAAMATKGGALAREQGNKVSDAVLRQVEETLHAAMIDTDAAAAVRTGLLTDPLAATGVGSLKVATAVADHTALGGSARPLSEVVGSGREKKGGPSKAGASGLRAVPGPDEEELAERRREERERARSEAAAGVEAAEAQLAEARGELASRTEAAQELQAACLQVNGEIDELKRRIDELEDRLEQLDEESDAAAEERDRAAELVVAAEADLADAQNALAELTD